MKNGDERDTVVMSLLWGMPDNSCNQADQGARAGTRIEEFTRMFTHGYVGDICSQDYGALLGEALTVIDDACNAYSPCDD